MAGIQATSRTQSFRVYFGSHLQEERLRTLARVVLIDNMGFCIRLVLLHYGFHAAWTPVVLWAFELSGTSMVLADVRYSELGHIGRDAP